MPATTTPPAKNTRVRSRSCAPSSGRRGREAAGDVDGHDRRGCRPPSAGRPDALARPPRSRPSASATSRARRRAARPRPAGRGGASRARSRRPRPRSTTGTTKIATWKNRVRPSTGTFKSTARTSLPPASVATRNSATNAAPVAVRHGTSHHQSSRWCSAWSCVIRRASMNGHSSDRRDDEPREHDARDERLTGS